MEGFLLRKSQNQCPNFHDRSCCAPTTCLALDQETKCSTTTTISGISHRKIPSACSPKMSLAADQWAYFVSDSFTEAFYLIWALDAGIALEDLEDQWVLTLSLPCATWAEIQKEGRRRLGGCWGNGGVGGGCLENCNEGGRQSLFPCPSGWSLSLFN
ncbi:hypothetical protein K440DRAFT_239945 [Wilcoxina mikolae CBS 423.85]|nr:hypothetical protein K440DRAFT_239945 [Wilcoxina mikolae CBS 423.85]